ncbi:RNA methyltransferase [Natroniella acetigena]|uniref:TrmH family RNA methyltransferase n=1 Tax=Natroniella acetigena TaxID=52004 RepID=UPI00200A6DE3|nr:RNA methyltransferase [Natroniella acetigena]
MEISSFTNDRVKYLRSLYQKKYRRQEDKFVLEGVRIIEEALQEQAKVETIFYSDYLLRNRRGRRLLDRLEEGQIELVKLTDDLLQKIADTVSPQGVLAIANKVNYDAQILSGVNQLILIVDRVQDPGNLGTIIRTADAAGVDGIIMTKGTVSLYNQKTIRSTMGSLFRVPIFKENNLDKLIESFKEEQIRLIVADLAGEDYHFNVDYDQSTAIIIGNEAVGPREELLDAADKKIKIPLAGGAESLNVAMATGIIIYEVVRQRLG